MNASALKGFVTSLVLVTAGTAPLALAEREPPVLGKSLRYCNPLVLTYLRHQLRNHTSDGSFLVAVIVVPLATFAICYVITSILMNIPMLRRTVC